MKKLISLLLAVITVFSMLQVTAFAETKRPLPDDPGIEGFSDVPSNHWAYPAVMWAVDSGVTAGMGNGTFGVEATVTRAQAVTFLWAYYGKPEPKTQNNPFTDVETTEWYYKAVLWAVENNITAGTGDNRFSPNNTLTNAQIITMLYAMAGKPDVTGVFIPYTNVSSSAYYYNALMWGLKKNLFDKIPSGYYEKENGSGSGRKPLKSFGYNWSCTRGVFVTLLYNHNNSVKVDMEKMIQLAVSKEGHDYADRYKGTNYGEYKFYDHWCAQFVSWCAERVGLVGTSDTAAMTYTGDCGDMLNHFLKKRTAYISNYFFTNENWNGRMEGYSYSTENAIEMYQSFLPKRGDLVFFTNFEDDAVGFQAGIDYLVQHVGIVTSVKPISGEKMKITTIEGNTDAYDDDHYWQTSHVAVKEYEYDRATGEITKGGFDYIVGFGRIR